jgi:transcription-repair coupling factor (superfamily II helicase)
MNDSTLISLYAGHPGVEAILSSLSETKKDIYVTGLAGSAAGLLCASVFARSEGKRMLCVLNDAEEAGYFYHDCCQTLGDGVILFFPSRFKRDIRYGRQDPAGEILRTEVLNRLNNAAHPALIVTCPEALAEKVVSRVQLKRNTLEIKVGEGIDFVFVSDVLDSYGFERVDYVYEPGQYAVRGSIVDIFSFSNTDPCRIDFFGNEVESIRSFDVETQLSKERLEAVSIVSAQADAGDATLFDYLEADTQLVVRDIDWVCDKLGALWNEAPAEAGGDGLSSPASVRSQLIPPEAFREAWAAYSCLHLSAPRAEGVAASFSVSFSTEPILSCRKNFERVAASFKEKTEEGYSIYILSNNEKQIKRIESIFADRGDSIAFTPILKTLHEGFIDHAAKIALYTDHQLFDRFHKYDLKSEKVRSGKVALSLKELQQFQLGDYLVHLDHGVGRFGGLIRTQTNGRVQEVVKMVFLNDDMIFVSIHNLHKISKYKGKDNLPPRLHKLGSGAWENLKNRTKKKVKDIAKELILLYSKRREEAGFAFSPDTYLQKELEASFLYEDTPDQLKATNDIKRDMESSRPMDRLVCGDVGFGKTEVAIRAAFKAVVDGKQVAVLAPTTLLAFQHYNTFRERLAGFPVTVDYLSRTRTTKDVHELRRNLASGAIDILIGTHRLINHKEFQFKDLGLLVIDEEQKFGVSVKEKLKHLKINVDTLTLTATPIPRTLQFSLMGARDLSNISTPPPNRYPIHTEIHRPDSGIIRDAVRFEMERNGQVFIINNRVSTLDKLADAVKKAVPEARIATGHGQMEAQALEQLLIDFANYEYDVLIATTIIENGIDIPNANTILVNEAQNFGLSDLHQLRGRVGRSNQKAFCYLLAPPLSDLTTEARRRLQAIENFSELGSGIHIAMQDLDIRGAGNMLGAEQSGFIADLGYETYQKILSEAVQELKNEEFTDLYKDENQVDTGENYVSETNVESDLELLFPATYIPNDSERILFYRELDSLESESDISLFRSKLQDRFGPIPARGEELIQVVRLRRIARRLGIDRIVLKNGIMTTCLVSDPQSPYYQSVAFDRLLEFAKRNDKISRLSEKNNRRLLQIQHIDTVGKAVAVVEEMAASQR